MGAYTGSASPYGTFDQGGNVHEWNEHIVFGSNRSIRGGSAFIFAGYLAASTPDYTIPTLESGSLGFRVASLVPEPGTSLLVMAGLAGLAARQRRRTRAL